MSDALEKLRQLANRLSSGTVSETEEGGIIGYVSPLVKSEQWQVRREAANVLGELRYVDPRKTDLALSHLRGDPNVYVSKAAERATDRCNKDRKKGTPTGRIPSPAESQGDHLYREVFDRIEGIGLTKISHRHIYDIATDFGNRAYAELAADTAHEVRSLLTPIEGSLVHMRGRTHENRLPTMQDFDAILSQIDTLKGLVESLQVYGASQIGPFEDVETTHLLDEVIAISMSRIGAGHNITLVTDTSPSISVHIVRKRLMRALVNIFTNALHAMPGGGELRVSASVDQESHRVGFEISDTGHGMSDKQVSQALRRFRSTRKDEGGTGLGLPIARKIIEQDHLGSIVITSSKGVGTCVRVEIPLNCKGLDQ